MNIARSRLKSIIKEELRNVLLEQVENVTVAKFDQQTGERYNIVKTRIRDGRPYAIIRNPDSPNIKGAEIVHDTVDLVVEGHPTRRVIIIKVWYAGGGSENIAFYSSSGTGGGAKRGQWVPMGGIVYRDHLAGWSRRDWIVKAEGKMKNRWRIIGKWIEEINKVGELPSKNVSVGDVQLNKILNNYGAIRTDWLAQAGEAYQNSQWYGLQKIKTFTTPVPTDPKTRVEIDHLNLVNQRIIAANNLLNQGLLTNEEYRIFRQALEFRLENEHLYEGSELEKKSAAVHRKIDQQVVRQKQEKKSKKSKFAGRAKKVGQTLKGRRGYVVLPDAVSKIINNSRQKTKVNKSLEGADMAKDVGADMQRQASELAKESGIKSKIFKIAGAVDTVMIADKAVKIIRDKKMSYKQQMDALYDLGEEVALEAGIATAAYATGPVGVAAYGLWVIGRLIASLPGESFETKDASGKTVDLHGGERETYPMRGFRMFEEFKNKENYLYIEKGIKDMKITKSQLKQIIKEEMQDVLEMFGRDIEMPDHSNKSKYPELLEAIKEVLDLSFGEGRYNLYKELRAMAEFHARNDMRLKQADQKAADEILSTRMGSYRGTSLPGGKKIK